MLINTLRLIKRRVWRAKHEARIAYLNARYDNIIHPTVQIGEHAEILRSTFAEQSQAAHHSSVRNTSVGAYSSVGRFSKVTHSDIGRFCAISWDVSINAANHPYRHVTVSMFPYSPNVGGLVSRRQDWHGHVSVGHDVWIGANAVILQNLKIGHGAIIGSNAVVTKDVPNYGIVVGVPARLVGYRFEDQIIERLLATEWWNYPREILKDNINVFKADVDEECLERLEELKRYAGNLTDTRPDERA